jgi:hypothetical protein
MIVFLFCRIHNESLTTKITKSLFHISIEAFGDGNKEHVIVGLGSSQ